MAKRPGGFARKIWGVQGAFVSSLGFRHRSQVARKKAKQSFEVYLLNVLVRVDMSFFWYVMLM